ncbi:MAG: XrtA/PEP-CTERM system-associated ATPase [Pseudomonadota bacterium]|uniref:General secretion pathway protein n=1 Tax=Sphingobium xenophagum TaxID=121428 RepID=A0A249MV16_SPHXE|nr:MULTISPECIES: XrtA/PEP-CTERM system-associated ATPase [Sphingobium]ASY45035.1 general secretion pathway protein [Sphingobium xenophagum]OUC54221.1 general secretion pathway protein [Sphingobium sp. GW456-12-10-14-TSB1]
MYDQYYGLQSRPFQLTPDPHYYFESATHRKALSYLGYGLAQGEGFIVITGDIGAGKTTLVGHLMQTIDPARLTAVKIVSTQVGGDDMLRLAAQSFGLATDGLSKAVTLQKVEAFLHGQARAGRRTLLIVDEAQNLPVSAIEELRMLSNFQLGGQSLLQIFLLGQPEFRDLLKSHQLEQLRQRVIATHHLEPMMAKEVEPYIIHRLTVAGWVGNPTFTPAAFDALYAATGGVPRRLNALVSRVLLMGAIDQLREIDADVVQAVVADMGLDVDVAPEPVAPSPLDSVAEVEEAPAAEIADEADSEAVVEQEEAEATAPAPFAAPFAAPQVDESPVAEASPDAVIGEPFYTAFDAVEEPVEAWDAQEAEEEPEIMEPEMVESATFEQSQPEQIEPQPVATIDADQVDALRHDMLAEIEALRAEISSLRAVQAHVPFTPAQTVDPEALKDCFTLIEERLQSLEFRAEEQDTALRRVLTLLVDWVEREERMAAPRDSAAA